MARRCGSPCGGATRGWISGNPAWAAKTAGKPCEEKIMFQNMIFIDNLMFEN